MIRVQKHCILIWECDGFISTDVSGYIGHNVSTLFPRKNFLPLNLDKVAPTKCLLLGAGTLESYVARTLMVHYPLPPPAHLHLLTSDLS